MSKILFTLAIPHDGPKRPQFIVSTNNLYAIQLRGTDLKTVKFGNANLGPIKHRFEYSVSGHQGVTRLSLIVNTSAILPHLTWTTAPPAKPAASKGRRSEDDRRPSRHSHSRHSPSGSSRRRRRRRHVIDDGNADAVDHGGYDGGHDGDGDADDGGDHGGDDGGDAGGDDGGY